MSAQQLPVVTGYGLTRLSVICKGALLASNVSEFTIGPFYYRNYADL